MASTTALKNEMLDGGTVDKLSLHSGDPGAAGEDNEVEGGGYARQAAVFAAADSGERVLQADVEFSTPGDQAVTWLGFWEAGEPDVFKGRKALTGDQAANAAGEYIVTTGTKIILSDPT